ncbi:hypothetical protein A3844_25020 [Paenibacillus helianthi]|uniref:Uncharacterized protein n=1 Tax=Paenibacillus helianthi TaxID=1349432 RepID=A0ABX3EHP2_9BACL|nr:hypothetical protein [Paenibacillus helianthi]OKP81850.1 hypothetical protein A3844_25020 [Paenibacillus helianthi]
MHIVHELNIEGETVNECVSVYDSAASIKPRESFPRSYPVELLRDPFQSAAESLSIGAARAEKFAKNTRLTFSSTVPGVAEMFAEEWARQ